MTTLLWNFYRKQIKSYIAGCVWTFSSPHTPFSLTTLLSPFNFCTVWSNCFWCDIILSQCYLPECQLGLGRHPHDALSAKSPGKCFPYWCCTSVVTHRRDSHSEPPLWWIGLRLESLLLMLQPFPDQRGMMEPLQRESTIFIYHHTSMWNLFQKSHHRTTLRLYNGTVHCELPGALFKGTNLIKL